MGETNAGEALSSCIASHDCSSMGMPSKGTGEGGGADSGCGDKDDGVNCSTTQSPVGVDGGSRLRLRPPLAVAPVPELSIVLCASLSRLGKALQPRHCLMDDGQHF